MQKPRGRKAIFWKATMMAKSVKVNIKKRAKKSKMFWNIRTDLRSFISNISTSAKMPKTAIFFKRTDGRGFLAEVRLILSCSLAFC